MQLHGHGSFCTYFCCCSTCMCDGFGSEGSHILLVYSFGRTRPVVERLPTNVCLHRMWCTAVVHCTAVCMCVCVCVHVCVQGTGQCVQVLSSIKYCWCSDAFYLLQQTALGIVWAQLVTWHVCTACAWCLSYLGIFATLSMACCVLLVGIAGCAVAAMPVLCKRLWGCGCRETHSRSMQHVLQLYGASPILCIFCIF